MTHIQEFEEYVTQKVATRKQNHTELLGMKFRTQESRVSRETQ